MKKFLLLVFILFFSVSLADATTWHVNKSGNDGNSCTTAQSTTAASAKLTIGAGLDCAVSAGGAGNTVEVAAGTYNESLDGNSRAMPTGTSWNNPFTLTAKAGDTVTLQPSGNSIIIRWTNVAAYSIINGFIFDARNIADPNAPLYFGTSTGAPSFIRVQNNQFIRADLSITIMMGHFATHNEILNNRFYNSQHGGGLGGALTDPGCNAMAINGGNPSLGCTYPIYLEGSSTLIEGNDFDGFPSYGIHGYSGFSEQPTGNIIRKNQFHNYGPSNSTGHDSRNLSALLFYNGSGNQVYNNIFYNGSTCAVDFTGDTKIYSNTCYNMAGDVNGTGGFEVRAGTNAKNNLLATITGLAFHDLFEAINTSNVTFNLCPVAGTGCTTVSNAPAFVAAGSDFHLSAGSPAISAGTDISAAIGCTASSTCTDYSGVTVRPQGAGWDIGAYEFVSGAVVTVSITGFNSTSCINTLTTVGTNTNGACTIIGQANNTIVLSGLSTQSGGSVTWSCDRCGSGSVTGTSAWTTSTITLKSGINNVTITGTDSSGSGADSIAINYAPTFPGDALVLALGFEDGSGTTATDSSGNSNTGTLINTPNWVTTGRFGKALLFNGINQYVRVTDTNSLRLTQSFTLSAWVQPSASLANFRAVIYKDGGSVGAPYSLYGVISSFGSCTAGGYTGIVNVNGASSPPGGLSACSSLPLQTGVWTHIAVTYDNATGQLKLYRMGVLVQTTLASGYMEPSTVGSPLDLRIGGSEFGENWQGLIDEVRVYNKALPITAASNTVAGAACTSVNFTDNSAVATASIVGNMNCPIINLNPPSQFKLSAGATQLKLGTSATAAKIGANP